MNDEGSSGPMRVSVPVPMPMVASAESTDFIEGAVAASLAEPGIAASLNKPGTAPPSDESSNRVSNQRSTAVIRCAHVRGAVAPILDLVKNRRARFREARPFTILIDGRSGSGKTTLGSALAEAWSSWRCSGLSDIAQLVHLDSYYPGWSGLRAAAEMTALTVLATSDPGYYQWNWRDNRRGEWVALDADRDLIIEGCGAHYGPAVAAALERSGVDGVITIRVEAADELRKHYALARDNGGFDPFWEMWAEQELEIAGECEQHPDLRVINTYQED